MKAWSEPEARNGAPTNGISGTRRLPVPKSRGVYSKGIPWWMTAPPGWVRMTPPASRLIVWTGYWRLPPSQGKEPPNELALLVVPHPTDTGEWFAVSRDIERVATSGRVPL